MVCCGNKRREWSKEKTNYSTAEALDSENPRKRQSKIFEFTGSRSLKIRGITTGNLYYFRFQGYRLEIPYEDAFAMMAETDLKVHTGG